MGKALAKNRAKTPSFLPVERAWLLADGSLTAHLEKAQGGRVRVRVAQQGLALLSLRDRRRLALPATRFAIGYARFVYLYNKKNAKSDEALVFASSVFCGCDPRFARLKRLKNTPMGYALFKNRRRLPHRRVFGRKPSGNPYRGTLYDWRGRCLWIEEEFLPPLFCLAAPIASGRKKSVFIGRNLR